MYKETFIQKLKQNNVSEDIEKTKKRMGAIWKAASKEDRKTIMFLADVALSTIQRVYKTGSISSKLVVPISQTLDINPFYLTGESDDMNGCTEEALREFLLGRGYHDLLLAHPPIRKKRGRTMKNDTIIQESAYVEDTEPEEVAEIEELAVPEAEIPAPEFFNDMTEDDMILLLRAILLRAKAGGKGAEVANRLKALLLGLQ